MSELKATTAQEIIRNEKDCVYMDELFGGVKMPPTQVYLKFEADKVIAHNKYKRCLAMAKWCDDAARLATWDADYHRCGWYNKWMQRWLKIAEQFKESK